MSPRPSSLPQGEPEPEPIHAAPRSRWPYVAMGIVVLVLIAGGAFAYYYVILRHPAPLITLSTSLPDKVVPGVPFEMAVSYENASDQPVQGTVLTVGLPEGLVLVGASPDKRFDEEEIGELLPGTSGKRTLSLLALSGAQTYKRFDVRLRYALKSAAGHVFALEEEASIAVGPPALDATLGVPQSVASGQDFDIVVQYRNTTGQALKNVRLALDYPSQLTIVNTTSTPLVSESGGGAWNLGAVTPNAFGTITVTAHVSGAAPQFALPAKLTSDIEGQTYTLWSASPQLTVAQAPLALAVTVNGARDFIAHPGDTLSYTLEYSNNSQVVLSAVKVTARLTGGLYDLARLRTDGSLDSRTNTLTWTAANAPALQSVAPSTRGMLTFTVPVLEKVVLRRLSDKNFSFKVEAVAESPTVPPEVTALKTISFANLETKLAGGIGVTALAYYYEPAANIKNGGTFPLRVDKPAQFTIHWRLKNGPTDMEPVHVEAKLPPGTAFTGKVQSSMPSVPVYDPQSGIVSWDIPRVAATQGIVGNPVEAVFQIEVIPAVNQIGGSVPLVGATTLRAKDSFTGLEVTTAGEAKNSYLPDDPKASGGGKVSP